MTSHRVERQRVERTVVVFDCESDGLPLRRSDISDTDALGPSDFRHVQCTCACAVVLRTEWDCGELHIVDKRVCWRDDAADPFEPLFDLFDRATVIVGFNALGFDFPLLYKHYGIANRRRYLTHRMKTHDIFERLRAATGLWFSLECLLRHNGIPGKTGRGDNAIKLWQANDRAVLSEYCLADVHKTAQLALLPRMVLGAPLVPNSVPMEVPKSVYAIDAALRASERELDCATT